MGAGTGASQDELGRRFEEIELSPDIEKLKYPGQTVSRNPVKSNGYADCNGVVLLDHGVVGMTHYEFENSNPEEYLPELIDEISGFADIRALIAVMIGGDTNHFRKNKETLKDYGIPIVAEYCDGWMEGEILSQTQEKKITKGNKDLVVAPETLEVIMYSRPVGFLRLSPPAP